MIFGSSIDPRIGGIIDDGSAEGIVGVRVKSGPLVHVPWREGHYVSSNFTLVTGAVGGGDNGDGSTTYLQSQQPTTLPSTPSYIRHIAYGTSYGVRFDPIFTSGGGGVFDFEVIIDRVPYRVQKARYFDDSLVAWSVQGNAMHGLLVASGLPDGPHYVEINVAPNVTTNGQRIFGFLADAKWYRRYPTRGYPVTTTLTNAFVTVSLWPNVPAVRGIGMRGILYANTDSVSRVVTVQQGGVTIWVETIGANSTKVFDPLILMGINSNPSGTLNGQGEYTHKADANSVVQATVIVGE